MAADPSASSPSPPTPAPGPRAKVRLYFSKAGPLRWLSHHDLLRTFERMLRRAELPVRQTQGFHPKPRLVFALSLPLGVAGVREVAEVELDEDVPAEAVRDRLARQCPPGLVLLDAQSIPVRSGARVRGLTYAVVIPPDCHDAVAAAIPATLALTQCLVERQKPTRRQVDIRPVLRDLRLDAASGRLEMSLWLLPSGTAKPDEVLSLLGLQGLLGTGAVLERTCLDLDEGPAPPAVEGAGGGGGDEGPVSGDVPEDI